jgi:hypothetical protein
MGEPIEVIDLIDDTTPKFAALGSDLALWLDGAQQDTYVILGPVSSAPALIAAGEFIFDNFVVEDPGLSSLIV